MSFNMPPQLDVCGYTGPLPYEQQMRRNRVEPTTALFRHYSALGEVLEIAASANEQETLEIVSAGCSIGAEIDTMLALAFRHLPDVGIRAIGLDENELVLDAAEAGIYHLRNPEGPIRDKFVSVDLDFDDELTQHGLVTAPCLNDGMTVIDAWMLRELYDVDAVQANLDVSIPVTRLAQLITCNNVLYHHRPEVATRIAVNLAG